MTKTCCDFCEDANSTSRGRGTRSSSSTSCEPHPQSGTTWGTPRTPQSPNSSKWGVYLFWQKIAAKIYQQIISQSFHSTIEEGLFNRPDCDNHQSFDPQSTWNQYQWHPQGKIIFACNWRKKKNFIPARQWIAGFQNDHGGADEDVTGVVHLRAAGHHRPGGRLSGTRFSAQPHPHQEIGAHLAGVLPSAHQEHQFRQRAPPHQRGAQHLQEIHVRKNEE